MSHFEICVFFATDINISQLNSPLTKTSQHFREEKVTASFTICSHTDRNVTSAGSGDRIIAEKSIKRGEICAVDEVWTMILCLLVATT